MAQSKSVSIIYGFCEGPMESKKFRVALRSAGFNVVSNPDEANIIFAHSGGCLLIPDNLKARFIFYCGYPYWPGKSILRALFQNAICDLAFHHSDGLAAKWIYKTFWNGVYFWKMGRNFQMLKNKSKPVSRDSKAYHVLIRNRYDKGCAPEIENLPEGVSQSYVTIPSGSHEDCWYNPETYVNLVKAIGS